MIQNRITGSQLTNVVVKAYSCFPGLTGGEQLEGFILVYFLLTLFMPNAEVDILFSITIYRVGLVEYNKFSDTNK